MLEVMLVLPAFRWGLLRGVQGCARTDPYIQGLLPCFYTPWGLDRFTRGYCFDRFTRGYCVL